MPETAIVQSEMKIVHGGEDMAAPIIYAIDAPEFPFSIEPACEGIRARVVKVPVASWEDSRVALPGTSGLCGEG